MTHPQLEQLGIGRYAVKGQLVFATASDLLGASREQFARDLPQEIDLSGITASDSAGLALLIEWSNWVSRKGGALRLTGTPPQLSALAKISDLDRVLSLNGN